MTRTIHPNIDTSPLKTEFVGKRSVLGIIVTDSPENERFLAIVVIDDMRQFL